ncbi:unnamed protein product [Chrysoparadoxa australica]
MPLPADSQLTTVAPPHPNCLRLSHLLPPCASHYSTKTLLIPFTFHLSLFTCDWPCLSRVPRFMPPSSDQPHTSIFLPGKSEKAIANRVSLLVNIAMNVAMVGLLRQLQAFAVERPVISLERLDLGYSMLAYFLSKLAAELPIELIFPAVFGPIVYKMSGLNNTSKKKLLIFEGFLVLLTQSASALGLMVGCLSPSMEVANLLGPAIVIVFLLLGGVHNDIPEGLKKLEDASTLRWGLEGMLSNEFEGLRMDASGSNLPVLGRVGSKKLKGIVPGKDVLERMGFGQFGMKKAALWLAGLTGGFHSVTLLYLTLRKPRFQAMEPLPVLEGPDVPQEEEYQEREK